MYKNMAYTYIDIYLVVYINMLCYVHGSFILIFNRNFKYIYIYIYIYETRIKYVSFICLSIYFFPLFLSFCLSISGIILIIRLQNH